MPPVLIGLDPFSHEASKTPAYFNSLISTLCSRSMHGTMLFSSRHTVPEWNSPHGADGIQRRYRLRAVSLTIPQATTIGTSKANKSTRVGSRQDYRET